MTPSVTQLTIGKKLGLGIGVMAMLILLMGGYFLWKQSRLNDLQDELATRQAVKLELAGKLDTAAEALRTTSQAVALGALLHDQRRLEAEAGRFGAQAREVRANLAKISPLLDTEAGKQAVGTLRDRLNSWESIEAEILQLARQGEAVPAAQLTADRAGVLAEDMDQATNTLIERTRDRFHAVDQEFDQMTASNFWVTAAMILICIAAAGVTFGILRSTTQAIRKVTRRLSENAGDVAASAVEIGSASQSLAQGASEQAAALEETSASSEEIYSMAIKNSDHSRAAAELVQNAYAATQETDQSLQQTVSAMNEIAASSEKIARIIKAIDEIAFQTNILALNAAVEAARAGEAGMGFAVVADEVRDLAQRSAQAARDTASLIEESISRSSGGKVKVDQAAQAIKGLSDLSSRVKDLVDQVNLASQEQAKGIEQVTRAITQMEQVTQRSAATAEQTAAAGKEMTAQSGSLREMVANLTRMVG